MLLSHGGQGMTMASLSNGGHLMVPNAAGYTVPGTVVEQAALGYLHANCANCYNDSPDGLLFPSLDMRLRAGDSGVTQTAAYVSSWSTKWERRVERLKLGDQPPHAGVSEIWSRGHARSVDKVPTMREPMTMWQELFELTNDAFGHVRLLGPRIEDLFELDAAALLLALHQGLGDIS
jgi:hypothetical protein